MKINDIALIYVNSYETTNMSGYNKEWLINCTALIGFEKT